MLSDEEKKAIEHLEKMKEHKNIMFMNWIDGEILLSLIKKQSKEIEELKEKNENLLDALNNSIDIKKYWVNKDKIKAKIEEAKKNYNDLHTKHLRDCGIAEQRELAKIEFGQSLLEKE